MKRHERGFLNPEPDKEERQQHALELSEAALSNGLRRQLEGAALVGAQLVRIRDEKLYQVAGCETFESYCRRFLEMSPERIRRYLDLTEVLSLLRTANLELPMNEAQALMLTGIPRTRLLSFWRTVLSHCVQNQLALTDRLVRQMVRHEIADEKLACPPESTRQKEAERSREGVKVTLEFSEEFLPRSITPHERSALGGT